MPLLAVMDSLKAKLEAFQRSRVGLFVKKALDDQVPNLGALLAWGTLSAMLPLLLGILAVAGLVLRDPATLDKVYSAIYAMLPSQAVGPIQTVLESVRQGATGAGIIAILLLLINGSGFFSNMASVFNQAYHVQGRMVLIERAIGLVMLLITTVLLIVSTLAAGISSVVSNIPGFLPIGPVLGAVVGWSISIVSVFVLFLLIYRVLPNVKQGWRDVVPGTLLAAVLLLLISQLFPIYVKLFPPNQAYALFGVFLLLTFYLYLLGIVLVLGAELNAFLQQPARSVALAEAKARAERGQAAFNQQTGEVTAEASGEAPAVSGGGPLGGRRRDPQQQVQSEQGGTGRGTGGQPQPKPSGQRGVAGALLGFVGLIVAAVLLRGQSSTKSDQRAAA